MTDLRNMFIVRHFNISVKAANSLPVISTLCPINWVVTHNDTPRKYCGSYVGIPVIGRHEAAYQLIADFSFSHFLTFIFSYFLFFYQ